MLYHYIYNYIQCYPLTSSNILLLENTSVPPNVPRPQLRSPAPPAPGAMASAMNDATRACILQHFSKAIWGILGPAGKSPKRV